MLDGDIPWYDLEAKLGHPICSGNCDQSLEQHTAQSPALIFVDNGDSHLRTAIFGLDVPPHAAHLPVDEGAPCHVRALVDIGQVLQLCSRQMSYPLPEPGESALDGQSIQALLEQLQVLRNDRAQNGRRTILELYLHPWSVVSDLNRHQPN